MSCISLIMNNIYIINITKRHEYIHTDHNILTFVSELYLKSNYFKLN
jgi:hypothetical protein